MIPNNITKEHIEQAINEIEYKGVPKRRVSDIYDLRYAGKNYPPKYIISIANKIANGDELNPSEFTGGNETNLFLQSRGFEVVEKDTTGASEFPIEKDSWSILSESIFIKKLDKSAFLHGGTGVPIEIRKYLGIRDIYVNEKRDVVLIFDEIEYKGYFEMTRSGRTRLMWKSEFAKALRTDLPEWYETFESGIPIPEEAPLMKLTRAEGKDFCFEVEIINNSNASKLLDLQPEATQLHDEPETFDEDSYLEEGEELFPEGRRVYRKHRSIERNTNLIKKAKKRAKKYNKELRCEVCNFSFKEVYGEIGEDFIEGHHIKPISETEGEYDAKIEDIALVCSNCHRMLHVKGQLFIIDELREIIKEE